MQKARLTPVTHDLRASGLLGHWITRRIPRLSCSRGACPVLGNEVHSSQSDRSILVISLTLYNDRAKAKRPADAGVLQYLDFVQATAMLLELEKEMIEAETLRMQAVVGLRCTPFCMWLSPDRSGRYLNSVLDCPRPMNSQYYRKKPRCKSGEHHSFVHVLQYTSYQFNVLFSHSLA